MASDADFVNAFDTLLRDVASATAMELAMSGKVPKAQTSKRKNPEPNVAPEDTIQITKRVLKECKEYRKNNAESDNLDTSDKALSTMAVFTDKFKLQPYEKVLHLVPRLVNCVTLSEAIPVEGTGGSLPLDLHRIAACCKNAYYAPRRFSAVQLAYSEPRCRVLVFRKPPAPKRFHATCADPLDRVLADTGRMVGTGAIQP